jgi:tetratricopeptide (TPR) repeat protein
MFQARFVFLFVALLTTPAWADRWERQKGDCEQVFKGWRTQSIDKLRDCVMLWEMYRNVAEVDPDQRAQVREPFDKLYQEGDKRDAVMALSALKKLGLRPTRLRDEAAPRDDTERQGEVVGKTPPPVVRRAPATEEAPEEVPAEPERKIDAREAKASYQRGIGHFKAGEYPEALSEFLISADSDPTYAQPLYMAAQAYVKLGKAAPAIQALARMKAMNSGLARQLIFQASSDKGFAPLYGFEAFKDLTGAAMIQILNAGGPESQVRIDEMAKQLEKAGMPVASISADRTRRQNTYLFMKPGYENQGERVRRELNLGMVHKRPIDWPSEFDVIVSYGVAGKTNWVDDEAEKVGKEGGDPEKKAKEEEAKKAAEDAAKAKEDMKKKLQMLQMMQEMDAEKSATDEAKSQADVLPPP